MKVLQQSVILFLLCLLGVGISSVLPFPFPGSVIAMLILFLLLMFRLLKAKHVDDVSTFLLKNMTIFFIPSGVVGMMNSYHLIQADLFVFLMICVVSTIITFVVTAYSVMIVMKWLGKRKEKSYGTDH